MVSACEPAVLAHKLGQLLEFRVVLVLLADLDPGPLLEEAVASLDALLDHVSVELWAGPQTGAGQRSPSGARTHARTHARSISAVCERTHARHGAPCAPAAALALRILSHRDT